MCPVTAVEPATHGEHPFGGEEMYELPVQVPEGGEGDAEGSALPHVFKDGSHAPPEEQRQAVWPVFGAEPAPQGMQPVPWPSASEPVGLHALPVQGAVEPPPPPPPPPPA